jgi:hypothetical protein
MTSVDAHDAGALERLPLLGSIVEEPFHSMCRLFGMLMLLALFRFLLFI